MVKNVFADSPEGHWYPGAIPYDKKSTAKPSPWPVDYKPPYPEPPMVQFQHLKQEISEETEPPDGGPAVYYDFPEGAITLNDLIEFKQMDFHLGNIFKAVWRYGTKSGTSKDYDCRKIIYSGARKLKQEVGVAELRKTLQAMLDDPQFQERN